MNDPIYSISTPILDTRGYHFDYPCKRSAYVDCCYALMDLNKAAKSAPDNLRNTLYRLKSRWLRHLYEQGYCVRAEQDEWLAWNLVFLVEGIRFQWHLPARCVTRAIREKRSPVVYEYRKEMPRRAARPLDESIALIEWILR